MAHVGIEPLPENISGDLRVVVLWSIVARFLLSLGFVLRCRRLNAYTCAFCVDACWARCRNRQPFCVTVALSNTHSEAAACSTQYTALHMIRGTQYKQLQIMLLAS